MKRLRANGGVLGKLNSHFFLGVRTCDLAVDDGEGAGVCDDLVILSLPSTHSTSSTPLPQSRLNSAIEISSLRSLQGCQGVLQTHPYHQPGDVIGQHFIHKVRHLGLQGLSLADILET